MANLTTTTAHNNGNRSSDNVNHSAMVGEPLLNSAHHHILQSSTAPDCACTSHRESVKKYSTSRAGDDDDEDEEIVLKPHRASTIPSFQSPKEAAAYLANQREDLGDMSLQRAFASCYRSEAHLAWKNRFRALYCDLSDQDRIVSLKILLREAADRNLSALKKRLRETRRTTTSLIDAGTTDDGEEESINEKIVKEEDDLFLRRQQQEEEAAAIGTTVSSWKAIESCMLKYFVCTGGDHAPRQRLTSMSIWHRNLVLLDDPLHEPLDRSGDDDGRGVSSPTARRVPPLRLPCRYHDAGDATLRRLESRRRLLRQLKEEDRLGKLVVI